MKKAKWYWILGAFLGLSACGTTQGNDTPVTSQESNPTQAEKSKDTPEDQAQNQQSPDDSKADPQNNEGDKPMVVENGFQMDEFKTKNGKVLKFYAIKHGSVRILYGNKEIEVDPVSDLDGKVTDYSELPKADIIIVTHEHYDHLDEKAIKDLTKDSTLLITNKNSAKQLGRGEVMANGDTKNIADDIQLEAVPAYNTTASHKQFHPQGRDNGFILTLDGMRVYIAGDTEDIEEMSQLHDIDIAFMPCNQPYTMTPEQLLNASNMVKPKVLFPYHYGDTNMEKVKSLFEGKDVDLRIRDYQ